ncbi:hypothetical protein ACSBR1_007078 [Camellia fascicularis]
MDDRFVEFNEDVDMVKPELKVGVRFKNAQYARLWDFCETVKQHNPNSCLVIKLDRTIVDEDDDEVERPNRQLTPVFERLYIRLDAQKQGFVQGYRPVVGLDGCFLKGTYGGQLLAAIGVDGNDNIKSFNKYILPTRDKPIILMVEWIRRKLMNRMQVKKNGMEKHGGSICPTVQHKLESNKENARNCFASFACELKFEVDCYDTTYVVDLKARTCGCRDWDLTGIPCKHAISYIYLTREKPEAYVHNCFSKETYLRTYSFMINPVPREHDWIETGYDAIAPPYYRKPTRRPRKEKKKATDEAKNVQRVSRKYKTVQYAKCIGFGHNRRSCKGPVHKKSTMFKRRGGPTTSSRKSASQPSKFSNASSKQATRHTSLSQPSATHPVLSQQATSTHLSSSQPAVATPSQPTMPCGASASASASASGNGNGFAAAGIN